ncbi:MAG: spore maturation protein [Clostridia bacterium]|nr:spore maturation protein [Clostridia bacterium]
MSNFVIPIFIIFLFIYCKIKKVNTYETFIEGAKKSLDLVCDIFAFLIVVFIMIELFNSSGLSNYLIDFISPIFVYLGIPKEVLPLIIIKPFSGSGSLSTLTQIYTDYGVDSYISRCASVILGSSETVFYVTSIYFSKTNVKKLGYVLPLGLLCTLISCILSCLICKIF